MKQFLLLIGAALFSATSFAQTLTYAGEEGEENTFELPEGSYVYAIFLGDETRAKLGIDDEHYLYEGVNENAGVYLYDWDETCVALDGSTYFNSYGVLGELLITQSVSSWSGWGYNVNAGAYEDLSGIKSNYTLHMSVMSTNLSGLSDPVDMYFTDGANHEAHIYLGVENGYTRADVFGNITDDKTWWNIDIPMEWLTDQYGLDFSHDMEYTDHNLFCWLFGPSPNTFAFDSIFFYGPENSEQEDGIASILYDENAPIEYYTLAGQRITPSQANNGVFVKKQGKTTTKVVRK